jgi:hypothetical protein
MDREKLIDDARSFALTVAHKRGHDILFDVELMADFALSVNGWTATEAATGENVWILAEQSVEQHCGNIGPTITVDRDFLKAWLVTFADQCIADFKEQIRAGFKHIPTTIAEVEKAEIEIASEALEGK